MRDMAKTNDIAGHVGRTRTARDVIRAWPSAALAATLEDGAEAPGEGDPLPPLRHWLHFLPLDPLSESGPDGHARTGVFLPDTGLPRRMWAGGRLTFHRPLTIGETAECVSRIDDVTEKAGRSGPLVFVRVVHAISGAAGAAITEEQDIVYREAPAPGAAPPPAEPAPAGSEWRRSLVPGPAMLFRYSALTFNSHRIHYDHPYVTETEGYPDLVVHAPLMATLMADLATTARLGARLASFSFRALAPVFAGQEIEVAAMPDGGDGLDLWIARSGDLVMRGEARFAP